MKAGIIVFPGTNCDRDTFDACDFMRWNPEYIWHNEICLEEFDVIFLPGGFSYGDYLRAGALAKFSPVINALKEYSFKNKGGIIGICNGFQILCEAGILPGALTVNIETRFICKDSQLEIYLNNQYKEISLPIAHKEGCYIADDKQIERLKSTDMIFLTYKNNPNGSIENIAGIYDKQKRIIGMMPHPERAIFKENGNIHGRYFFEMIEKEWF